MQDLVEILFYFIANLIYCIQTLQFYFPEGHRYKISNTSFTDSITNVTNRRTNRRDKSIYFVNNNPYQTKVTDRLIDRLTKNMVLFQKLYNIQIKKTLQLNIGDCS